MPTQGTQVYWHELPVKQPPWRNAAELRECIQKSKQVATSSLRTQWGGASLNHSQRPQRLLTEHEKSLKKARQLRSDMVRQLENPRLYRGVVPEPNATPLRVVNLIMTHLGQPTVSIAEAAAAVDKVLERYDALTQLSQSQTRKPTRAGGGDARIARRSRAPPPRRGPVAAAMSSVLSQSQLTDVPGSTQPSQPSQKPVKRSAGLATDMQNALLLDVVGEFCGGGRALRFKRLSRSDLSAMKWQVTSVDAVPHRRVVLLADRRDPYFVVLFGVAHGVRPEPYVVATLKEDGRTPDALHRYNRPEVSYTQVFCVAPAPVPWRRLWKNISFSAYRNEFAAAVVELDTDNNDGNEDGEGQCVKEGASETEARPRANISAGHEDRSPIVTHPVGNTKSDEVLGSMGKRNRADHLPESRRPRTETLLGAWDDEEEEEDMLRPGGSTGLDPSPLTASSSSPSVSAFVDARAMTELKWISEEPLFDEDAPTTHSEHPFDGAVGEENEKQPDPLQRLPRTDARDRMANAKLRVWYRRVLPRPMAAELMGRLRELQHDEM